MNKCTAAFIRDIPFTEYRAALPIFTFRKSPRLPSLVQAYASMNHGAAAAEVGVRTHRSPSEPPVSKRPRAANACLACRAVCQLSGEAANGIQSKVRCLGPRGSSSSPRCEAASIPCTYASSRRGRQSGRKKYAHIVDHQSLTEQPTSARHRKVWGLTGASCQRTEKCPFRQLAVPDTNSTSADGTS